MLLSGKKTQNWYWYQQNVVLMFFHIFMQVSYWSIVLPVSTFINILQQETFRKLQSQNIPLWHCKKNLAAWLTYA